MPDTNQSTIHNITAWLALPNTALQIQKYIEQHAPEAETQTRNVNGIIAGGCIADALFALWDQHQNKPNPLKPAKDYDIFTLSPTTAPHSYYKEDRCQKLLLRKAETTNRYQIITISSSTDHHLDPNNWFIDLLEDFDLNCCRAGWIPDKPGKPGQIVTTNTFIQTLATKKEAQKLRENMSANTVVRLIDKCDRLGLTCDLLDIIEHLTTIPQITRTSRLTPANELKLRTIQQRHPILLELLHTPTFCGSTHLIARKLLTQDMPELPPHLKFLPKRKRPIALPDLGPFSSPSTEGSGWHEATAYGRLKEALACCPNDTQAKTAMLSSTTSSQSGLPYTVIQLAARSSQLDVIRQRFPNDPDIRKILASPLIVGEAARGWCLNQIQDLITPATLRDPDTFNTTSRYGVIDALPALPELPTILAEMGYATEELKRAAIHNLPPSQYVTHQSCLDTPNNKGRCPLDNLEKLQPKQITHLLNYLPPNACANQLAACIKLTADAADQAAAAIWLAKVICEQQRQHSNSTPQKG